MKLIPNLAPIDRQAIDELGIPSQLLMEEAGRQVASLVFEAIQVLEHRNVVVVCGTGNNGGDGFVCARHLSMMGVEDISVVHMVPGSEYRGDARTNYELLNHYGVHVVDCADASVVKNQIRQAAVVVDALFGSGLTRPLEGLYSEIVGWINDPDNTPEQLVVAVDIPSGVSGETGQVLGSAVKADFTVTFAAPKPGLYLPPGKSHAGVVRIVDIGIPKSLIEKSKSPLRLTLDSFVRHNLPHHGPENHKYQVGSLLVVAGSSNMPGAASLCADAAISSGAGVVTLAAVEDVFRQVNLMPEVIHAPLPSTKEGVLGLDALENLEDLIKQKKCQAVVIGPGIGHGESTRALIESLLKRLIQLKLPFVLDADGLNCLSQVPDSRQYLTEQSVLTPHLGECSRLLGVETDDIAKDLIGGARSLQEASDANVILKTSTMISALSDGTTWINPTGNVGMATAGSGDVLTGIVGSLLAQGLSPRNASICGPYIHGLAGDLAAQSLSSLAMKASDISKFLPAAFQQVIMASDGNGRH